MNLQYSGEPGSSLELEETAPTLEKLRHPKRIPVKCRQRNRFIPLSSSGWLSFPWLACCTWVSIGQDGFTYPGHRRGVLGPGTLGLLQHGPDFFLPGGDGFYRGAFPAVQLSTGCGVRHAGGPECVPRPGAFRGDTGAFHLFAGGAHSGVGAADAGLFGHGARSRRSWAVCHTTAFFTKSFAQSFESIPEETIEALEVTGASRLSIFCNAILPAAFSQIVAWRACAWRPIFRSAPFWAW